MTTALDATKPNVARMYDYWLGGKDNFKADRDAAEAVLHSQALLGGRPACCTSSTRRPPAAS